MFIHFSSRRATAELLWSSSQLDVLSGTDATHLQPATATFQPSDAERAAAAAAAICQPASQHAVSWSIALPALCIQPGPCSHKPAYHLSTSGGGCCLLSHTFTLHWVHHASAWPLTVYGWTVIGWCSLAAFCAFWHLAHGKLGLGPCGLLRKCGSMLPFKDHPCGITTDKALQLHLMLVADACFQMTGSLLHRLQAQAGDPSNSVLRRLHNSSRCPITQRSLVQPECRWGWASTDLHPPNQQRRDGGRLACLGACRGCLPLSR